MDGSPLGTKSFEIRKRLVYEAWMKVQANGGAPGVDTVSIEGFADNERDNLYKLWNRMSSGSYFPGPVRAVEIPKDHGAGVRVFERPALSIPSMVMLAANQWPQAVPRKPKRIRCPRRIRYPATRSSDNYSTVGTPPAVRALCHYTPGAGAGHEVYP
jgi:hypothetical protein